MNLAETILFPTNRKWLVKSDKKYDTKSMIKRKKWEQRKLKEITRGLKAMDFLSSFHLIDKDFLRLFLVPLCLLKSPTTRPVHFFMVPFWKFLCLVDFHLFHQRYNPQRFFGCFLRLHDSMEYILKAHVQRIVLSAARFPPHYRITDLVILVSDSNNCTTNAKSICKFL